MTAALLDDIARRCAAAPPDAPKYIRLIDALEGAVSDGLLLPGDRLPTETELTSAVPYALGTVQKALNGLVSRGIVYRSRRSGTFVAETARALDDMSRFSFERPDGLRVDEIFTRTVECLSVSIDERIGNTLGPAGSEGYLRISRIDEVDGAFACCSETYLIAERFPGLAGMTPESLSGLNLRTMLARRFGATTARLSFAARPCRLPERVNALLGLPKRSAGLELEITGRAASGDALFVQALYVPQTDYRIRFADVAA